jgi:hypothetical protein
MTIAGELRRGFKLFDRLLRRVLEREEEERTMMS